jgi:hypothetical protein
MSEFMGDGFNALSFLQRISKPDSGALGGETSGCGRMFFLTPMPFPVCNHLYPDILHIGSRFFEKFRHGFRFQGGYIKRLPRAHGGASIEFLSHRFSTSYDISSLLTSNHMVTDRVEFVNKIITKNYLLLLIYPFFGFLNGIFLTPSSWARKTPGDFILTKDWPSHKMIEMIVFTGA